MGGRGESVEGESEAETRKEKKRREKLSRLRQP